MSNLIFKNQELNQNQRAHKRFSSSLESQSIIMQHHWENFCQVVLCDNSLIIGQIIDISEGGIALQTAYNFDILEPVPAQLILSSQKPNKSIFAYDMFKIKASVVRCKPINDLFSLTALKFEKPNEKAMEKLNTLIKNISNQT